jgi:hypothetical protein
MIEQVERARAPAISFERMTATRSQMSATTRQLWVTRITPGRRAT